MDINVSAMLAAVTSFILIVGIMFFLQFKQEKKLNKLKNLDKLNYANGTKEEDEEDSADEDKNTKKKFNLFDFEYLREELKDADLTMEPSVFVLGMILAAVVMFMAANWVFKSAIVSLAPIPFCLYLLPKMILIKRKKSAMLKFNKELVIVLRRMASILQNGSILMALEDVKDLSNLSPKMHVYLNEVYHNISFGDDIIVAFRKAVHDIKSPNLELFICTTDLNKELGSDIAGALNSIAMRIQTLDLSRKEAKSLLASTSTIGTIIGIIPFGLMLYMGVTNPSYFPDYLTTIDHQIIFFCIVLFMFIGLYVVGTQSENE